MLTLPSFPRRQEAISDKASSISHDLRAEMRMDSRLRGKDEWRLSNATL